MTIPSAVNFSEPTQRQALELMGKHINCGLVLRNASMEYDILYVNKRLAQYMGYSHDDFNIGFPRWIDCIFDDDRSAVRDYIALVLEKQDHYDLNYRIKHKDGSIVWVRENGQCVYTSDGECLLLCILVDISADMLKHQRIELQSKVDPLTNVLNRISFKEQMERLLNNTLPDERCHVFIILDVDRFKGINDNFGHIYGDTVIEDIAQTLRSVIRSGDLLGRLGGDEFVLCLRDIKLDKCFKKRIEHIRELLHKQLRAELKMSCSMGVSIFRKDGENFDDLYRHADIALYEAKRQGRNRIVFFSPEMIGTAFYSDDSPINKKK